MQNSLKIRSTTTSSYALKKSRNKVFNAAIQSSTVLQTRQALAPRKMVLTVQQMVTHLLNH